LCNIHYHLSKNRIIAMTDIDIELSYKQDVVINNDDCIAHIESVLKEEEQGHEKDTPGSLDEKKHQKYKSKISIFFHGSEYTLSDLISHNKLKRLQDGFRNKSSLESKISFKTDGSMLIRIFHPFMDSIDEYILKKQSADISLMSLYDSRIKTLENNTVQTFLITKEMIGPCFKPVFKMSLKDVQKSLSKHGLTDQYGKKVSEWREPDLNNYFKMEYVFQKDAPSITKNQLVIPGLLAMYEDDSMSVHNYKKQVVIRYIDNTYTILKKKYKDDVIAIITKTHGRIEVKFIHYFTNSVGEQLQYPTLDLVRGCPHVKIRQNGSKYCEEKAFYEFCHLMSLPEQLNVPDAIYEISGSSKFIMVKNNKLYISFEKIKEGDHDNFGSEMSRAMKYGVVSLIAGGAMKVTDFVDKTNHCNMIYYNGFCFDL
jgi:hypothetical protein